MPELLGTFIQDYPSSTSDTSPFVRFTWQGKRHPCFCADPTSEANNQEIDRWNQGFQALVQHGYKYEATPVQDWSTLSASIGIARAISYSLHERDLKGKVNYDFVNMDKMVIKVMATSFVTCSYKPQLGNFNIPENPNKRTDEDKITIRVSYDERKVDMMDLMRKRIWSLSKFLYDKVSLVFSFCCYELIISNILVIDKDFKHYVRTFEGLVKRCRTGVVGCWHERFPQKTQSGKNRKQQGTHSNPSVFHGLSFCWGNSSSHQDDGTSKISNANCR